VGVNALMMVVLANPARADGPTVALAAGYTFRSQIDGRQHGVAALASADSPSWGPLALRADVLALWIPGADRDDEDPFANRADLALAGGALSLVYRFDETDVRALAAVGPLAALSVDGDAAALRAGALASAGLRFPILPGVDVEGRLLLPVLLYGPEGFTAPIDRANPDGTLAAWPLQFSFLLGVALDPVALFASLADPPSEPSDPLEGLLKDEELATVPP
jgi:hypothetical protein